MRHTIIDRLLYVACAAAAVAAAGGCGHSDMAAPAVTPAPVVTQQMAPGPATQQAIQMQNATEAMDEQAHEHMVGAKSTP